MRAVMGCNALVSTVGQSGFISHANNIIQENGSNTLSNCCSNSSFKTEWNVPSLINWTYLNLNATSLPSEGSPSWVQTTVASASSHESSQTVPHWLLKQISTLPSAELRPPRSLISPFWQRARYILGDLNQTVNWWLSTKIQLSCTRLLLTFS